MPVIKNNTSTSDASIGKMAALNIANFTEQAQRIVTDARLEADTILAAARDEAAEIAETARAQAYAAGQAQGLADGQADGAERAFNEAHENFAAQTQLLQQVLRETIGQVEQARDKLLLEARSELLEFALILARKITHVQAGGDIVTAQRNLAAALEMASCAGTIQAKVFPEQLDQLREYAGLFMEEMGMSNMMKFTPDPTLSAGDVVLQTRNGEVDARIQTQLDNVIRAVTGQEPEAPIESNLDIAIPAPTEVDAKEPVA